MEEYDCQNSKLFKSIMWQYINEIPTLAKSVLDNNVEVSNLVNKLLNVDIKRIIVIGHGSSFNSALIAKETLKNRVVFEIEVLSPNEFQSVKCGIDKETTLIVLISQEGNSSGVIDIAKESGDFTIVGISSGKENLLAKALLYHIDIKSGEEISNAKTKGVTCTILTLISFIIELSKDKEVIQSFKDSISLSIDNVNYTYESFKKYFLMEKKPIGVKPRSFCLVHSFEDDGIIQEAMIKLIETSLIPTVSANIEEFTHGVHRYIGKDDVIIILTDSNTSKHRDFLEVNSYYQKGGVYTIFISDSNDFSDNVDIKYYYNEYTKSFLNKLLIFQLLSVLIPESFLQDPNINVHQEIALTLDTRKTYEER